MTDALLLTLSPISLVAYVAFFWGRPKKREGVQPTSLLRLGILVMILVAAGLWVSASPAPTVLGANPSATLDQCENGSVAVPHVPACNPDHWIHGNLGASDAHYFEDDSVPYRLVFSDLPLAPAVHTVNIEWDTTQSGKHAIDYITTYNRTITTANPCVDPVIPGCNPAVFTTFPIPTDPTVSGAGVTQIPGVFTMFGGATISSVSAYSLVGSYSGNSSTNITITFTTTVANPVLAWGGHIATRLNWGANNSASAISGSPFHMRLNSLDGQGGNQDRSLSAAAVIYPGSITIIKDAQPDSTNVFSFTASPAPLTAFTLVDDGTTANTRTFANITNFQSYVITEATSANWASQTPSCVVTSPNGGTQSVAGTTATINLAEGENVTCVFINISNQPDLTITKTPDNASVTAPSQIGFTITVIHPAHPLPNATADNVVVTDVLPTNAGLTWTIDAANSDPGCSITAGTLTCNFGSLAPGTTRRVHITSPTTFATCGTVNNTATVTSSNHGTQSATASVNVVCPLGSITIVKDSQPNSAQAFSFSGALGAFTLTDDGSPSATRTFANLQPGTYPVTEAPVATWFLASISCSDGSSTSLATATATIGLGQGENVTCTFVKLANPPDLALIKVADSTSVTAPAPMGFAITVIHPAHPAPNATADNVVVTDPLPANPGLVWTIDPVNSDPGCTISAGVLTCNFGSMAPGTTRRVHITSATTFATCGTVNDTATVTSSNHGTLNASASITVICPLGSITIVKDSQPNSAQVFSYSGALGAFTLTDDGSPSATRTFANLQPGTYAVTEAPVATWFLASISCSDGSSTSIATATATIGLGQGENVTCTFVNLSNQPDLAISKEAERTTVTAPASVGFIIIVTHPTHPAPNATADNVVLTDQLPVKPGLAWTIEAGSSDPGCSITAGVLTCNFGSMAPGTTRRVFITSPTTIATCGAVNDTATVTSSNHGTLSASASVNVICPPPPPPPPPPGTPTPTPTASPTPTPLMPKPVPPQIFQNPGAIAIISARPGGTPTPTPVLLPVAVAPAVSVIPTVHPPNTGDAGLTTDASRGLRQRREQQAGRYDLGSFMDEVRERLDEIVAQERCG